MRKCVLSLLAGVASVTLVAAAASAADLPRQAPPPAPIIAAPIFTWTGFYIGGNLGWGWRNSNNDPVILGGPGVPGGLVGGTLIFDNNNDGAFTGGGQIGYNYQIGNFVIGVETDIQGIDNGNNNAVFIPGPGFAGTFVPGRFNNSADWWGSTRVRAGFAVDRVLIYATGGVAYTDNDTGWAVGGGIEWALPTNWNLFGGNSAVTLGLEGLWVSIDQSNDNNGIIGTFTPVGGAPVDVFWPQTNNDQDFFVARAKLNFKFGTY
ncbi:porin family protein [Microvirga sp. Marseille-Q2068]|uniref:Porin family protein n=1 Tax=Microvirga mediterraneensis TaxID=2754695 RepID=A0A838BP63_9HYPH|nr:outer membrane beta-barrel protein [Microvirga mediterraneensis]MBA1156682.1 porin family protein [Microvirga mediterraneensis]